MDVLRQLRGHIWSIVPTLRNGLILNAVPPGQPWRARVADDRYGHVSIHGCVHPADGADTGVVLVHGHGGSLDSFYIRQTANIAHQMGMASLRLGLRGSDLTGEDLYYAGLTSDIHAAVGSPEFADYRHILIVGFSLGGHATLCLATENGDPRIRAVASICSPLDLQHTQRDIDRRRAYVYRRFLLDQLRAEYIAIYEKRGHGSITPDEARAIKTFAEWDQRVTAPRWGFDSGADLYRRTSVGSRLHQLKVPTLIVNERRDPMVTEASVAPSLQTLPAHLTVRWTDSGGHVGYPGQRRRDALYRQVLDWLRARVDADVDARRERL